MYRRYRPGTALESRPSDASFSQAGLVSPRGEDRSRRAPVKEPHVPDPKRLPPTGAHHDAAKDSGERRPLRCVISRRARHLARSFAARGPASSTGALRVVEVHHPGDGKPRGLLSTSAITTVLQHGCGSTFHPVAQCRFGSRLPLGGSGRPHASRREAGRAVPSQGPPSVATLASSSPALAHGRALPRPGRLAHPLSRLSRPPRPEQPETGSGAEAPAIPPASDTRAARFRAATAAPPRRGALATHPGCVPSTGGRGPSQYSTGCSQLVEYAAGRLWDRRGLAGL